MDTVSLLVFHIFVIYEATLASIAKRNLDCSEENHLINGQLIFVNGGQCGDVINARVKRYDTSFVTECNRQMGYSQAIKKVIDASVISCDTLSNGAIRYWSQICCPGKLTKTRCFTCANEDVQYDNVTGKYRTTSCDAQRLETCNVDEVCTTTFNYHPRGDGTTLIKVTKGCTSSDECRANQRAGTCRDKMLVPSCTTCCDKPLCNEQGKIRKLTAYDPNLESDPCNERNILKPNPCKNDGVCTPTGLSDPKFTCICQVGFHGDECQFSGCSPDPCNGHFCKIKDEPPFYTCHCKISWFGQHCTQQYSMCEDNICLNGGTCFEQAVFERCLCPLGFVGGRCEIKQATECASDELHFMDDSIRQHALKPSSTGNCTGKHRYVKAKKVSPGRLLKKCAKYFPDFKDGRNGAFGKMYMSKVWMTECEQGDSLMRYKIDFCCPACLANPCQNGGWCSQDGEGFICKCRFGFSGLRCQYKTTMCVVSGDPHYMTFSDRHIIFQGVCKYDLVSLQENVNPDFPAFAVYNKNEHRGTSTNVSYLSYIEVHAYGHVMRLGRDNVVTVDGVALHPDFDLHNYADGRLTVQRNGRFVRVETDFGLIVDNDGKWVGMVRVPGDITNMASGICNDRGTVTDWTVHDLEDDECFAEEPPVVQNCTDDEKKLFDEPALCGLLAAHETNSPFADCRAGHRDLADMYHEICLFDACANKDDDETLKQVACGSLEAFAESCADKGFDVEWREAATCPMDCKNGQVYNFRGTSCPSTCTRPRASQLCSIPDTEVCACPERQVLLDDKCVEPEECGCTAENGEQVTTGTSWLSSDCRMRYTCEFCEDCDEGYGRVTSKPARCPSHSPVCEGGQCAGMVWEICKIL